MISLTNLARIDNFTAQKTNFRVFCKETPIDPHIPGCVVNSIHQSCENPEIEERIVCPQTCYQRRIMIISDNKKIVNNSTNLFRPMLAMKIQWPSRCCCTCLHSKAAVCSYFGHDIDADTVAVATMQGDQRESAEYHTRVPSTTPRLDSKSTLVMNYIVWDIILQGRMQGNKTCSINPALQLSCWSTDHQARNPQSGRKRTARIWFDPALEEATNGPKISYVSRTVHIYLLSTSVDIISAYEPT